MGIRGAKDEVNPTMHMVITGSSSGIGRALAERLLARGHHVWGLARSDQTEFTGRHAGAFHATRCDVGDWAQVAAAARAVGESWPHLDGLITCAGLQGAVGPTVSIDPLHWSATVRANLDGTFYSIRAFHELLQRTPRRAKIVCFSGGGATKARPNFSAYGAAKTAIVRLVETLAGELGEEPLDINAIAPGAINTRMTDEVLHLGPAIAGAAEHQAALKQKASGDTSSLERALDLVEWLLSASSDGISGRLISARWDPWPTLDRHKTSLAGSDVYTLRRIMPEDRGQKLNDQPFPT
ncbi:MAG TPA: SDR family oxidoreductase [Opitutaceae bacterium]|jgi:NAD(P)-dependent dehydrogenase (short-subunit alcohol dehydrogenase family)|nr:SDR family oxidoreductase [Opitutaceae bacterium]